MRPWISLALVAGLLVAARPADACTTFLMPQRDGGFLVGKSYDWNEGAGLVMHNKAGVAKQALVFRPGDKPASWTSRYASLTFNQYGRELPNGGMNEAGLVVEIMWLDSSRYPDPDERPALNELQWIQYQLDRFATVAEVVEAAPSLRVSPVHAAVHYLACDKGGTCAAFEYLDGKLVVSHGESLPVPVLTNNDVATSADYLGQHRGFGGKKKPKTGQKSLERYVRAAVRARKKGSVGDAFSLLKNVGMGDYSKWNIVYDPQALEVHFRTRDASKIKKLKLKDFDRACGSTVQVLSMTHNQAGDARKHFRAYARKDNETLINRTVGKLGLPKFMTKIAARFPETYTCAKTPAPASAK